MRMKATFHHLIREKTLPLGLALLFLGTCFLAPIPLQAQGEEIGYLPRRFVTEFLGQAQRISQTLTPSEREYIENALTIIFYTMEDFSDDNDDLLTFFFKSSSNVIASQWSNKPFKDLEFTYKEMIIFDMYRGILRSLKEKSILDDQIIVKCIFYQNKLIEECYMNRISLEDIQLAMANWLSQKRVQKETPVSFMIGKTYIKPFRGNKLSFYKKTHDSYK